MEDLAINSPDKDCSAKDIKSSMHDTLGEDLFNKFKIGKAFFHYEAKLDDSQNYELERGLEYGVLEGEPYVFNTKVPTVMRFVVQEVDATIRKERGLPRHKWNQSLDDFLPDLDVSELPSNKLVNNYE